MDKKDIAEQSYSNGYKQGVKDFAEKLKAILEDECYLVFEETINQRTGKEDIMQGYERIDTLDYIEAICAELSGDKNK